MAEITIPAQVPNWIDGKERPAKGGELFDKADPATGKTLVRVARSREADVADAVAAARRAYPAWLAQTPVARGDRVRAIAIALQQRREEFAKLVARETGKSLKDARGEVGAAVEMGFFVAGEGRRWYGRTTTSAVPNKQ